MAEQTGPRSSPALALASVGSATAHAWTTLSRLVHRHDAHGKLLAVASPFPPEAPTQVSRQVEREQRSAPHDADALARTSLTYLCWAFGPDGANAPGTLPGCMVASPSRPQSRPGGKDENESYFFQWSRDGGICVRALVSQWIRAEAGECVSLGAEQSIQADRLRRILIDFFEMNIRLQRLTNRSGPYPEGIGEPKYNVDATPFDGNWGRPQNDGPAVRALAALAFCSHVLVSHSLDSEMRAYVVSRLYVPSSVPAAPPAARGRKEEARGLIVDDLDYVASHWDAECYELWEEVKAASHFHTLMVQRAALVHGAALANRLEGVADRGGSSTATTPTPSARARRWLSAATKIEARLERHWNPDAKLHLEGGAALLAGPRSIRSFGDGDARRLHRIPAQVLRTPHVVGSLGRVHGPQKPTQVDTAVLLGFLHAFHGHLGRGATPTQPSPSRGSARTRGGGEAKGRNGGVVAQDGRDLGGDEAGEEEEEHEDVWMPWGERCLVTLDRCTRAFAAVYELNEGRSIEEGVLCGRYPEDAYDGVGESVAHPWFLCAHAVAEVLYLTLHHYTASPTSPPLRVTRLTQPFFDRLARYHDARDGRAEPRRPSRLDGSPTRADADDDVDVDGQVVRTGTYARGTRTFARCMRGLRSTADGYLDVARSYVGAKGEMSEQVNRRSGAMQGARELSWSYASYLSAYEARMGRSTPLHF